MRCCRTSGSRSAASSGAPRSRVALGTLMLGIGANTAIFTLVNALLLRPLPYVHPEQLVSIWGTSGAQKQLLMSLPDVVDLRERNHTFSDIGVVRTISVNLTGGDGPIASSAASSPRPHCKLLGAKTAAGRLFTEDETALGAGQQVVVLSYAAWKARFGGRADALGKTMILNGRPHVVIGVTAADFSDPFEAELWLPITSAPSQAVVQSDGGVGVGGGPAQAGAHARRRAEGPRVDRHADRRPSIRRTGRGRA